MFDTIDEFYREETAEILLICLEAIQPLSLIVLWFYEQEKASTDYVLKATMCQLSKAEVETIFHKIQRRIKARGQDLLEIEVNLTQSQHLMYTVRFSHRTIQDFLLKPEILAKLNSWKSKGFDARVALCKEVLGLTKSSELLYENAIRDFCRYAYLIECDNVLIDERLIDELQAVVSDPRKTETWTLSERFLKHIAMITDWWAHFVEAGVTWPFSGALPPTFSILDQDTTNRFLALAVEANLKRYIEQKLTRKPYLIRRASFQRPILDRALRLSAVVWGMPGVDPDMIRLLLLQGANPNEELTIYTRVGTFDRDENQVLSYDWTTVWALFLDRLLNEHLSRTHKTSESLQRDAEAAEVMIEYGAAADLGPWRISALRKPFSGPRLTPSGVFHKVFPPPDAMRLDQLLRKHRQRAFRRACSWLKRTILLWLYLDIHVILWLMKSIYPLVFNPTFGVILPMIILPLISYGVWLAWPLIRFVMSCTAPVLLPALILSEWLPNIDLILWCEQSLIRPCLYWAYEALRHSGASL